MRRPGSASGEPPIVLITFPDYDMEASQHGGAFTAAGIGMRVAAKRGARSRTNSSRCVTTPARAIASTDPFTERFSGTVPIYA